MQRWFALFTAFLVAGCTTAGPTAAQATYPETSPPLIAGRVALAEGDARIWRVEDDAGGNAGEWDEAETNDVVSAGTGLYTGPDGRNEVRVGPHTFRLAANSRGGFSQLDYSSAVFDLEYGSLNVRLARAEHGETTAVTVAGVRLELAAPGRYRVDATDRGPLRLTVFDGHGTVRAPNTTVGVAGSQAIVLTPGVTGYNFEQPVSSDFDQWALARDDRFRDVRSAQYVSPYMTGYEELDVHGDWVPDGMYGTVWYPRAVPVGWAPYRHGQWRWVRPWGWTWVDQAPWGYAPFHYGRWVLVGTRWAWVPGGYVPRPVWAPALVGFVGSGVSVSVNVGGPVVGWYPLAPWHRYEPHYRHSPTYITIINQTVINRPPAGVPRNINHGPGATLVPGSRFREPVMRTVLPVRPRPEDLRPMTPPPLNVAPAPRPTTRKFAEQDGRPDRPDRPIPGAPARTFQPGQPPQAGQPPQSGQPPQPGQPPQAGQRPMRVTPPMAADPVPGRGLAPQPAVPGNDPAPLTQPPRTGQPPQPGQPPQGGRPPTRVTPPMTADPVPGRGLSPQPALPGNDPAPLAQPPRMRALPPGSPPVPPAPRGVDRGPDRTLPRPNLPSDQIPPGQARPINPAEPPRFPPGAPPTIRAPMAPAMQPAPAAAPSPQAVAPPPRPTSPAVAPAPRPVVPAAAPGPAPAPAAVPPPRAETRSRKEEVLRNAPQSRGRPEDAKQ
jgi:hypothetical protein